jgi:subtilisin family serine protease
MPVKVLGADGSGTYQQIADGVYWAVDNGAEVMNASLGGSYSSNTMYNAVRYAYDNGVVIVASTGNDNSAFLSYPAAYDECIAVGAVDTNKNRAPYSNYGTGMELMAPGGNTSEDENGDGYVDGVLQQTFSGGDPTNFAYWFWQGTSMAAPHVTGLIALILSGWSASGIENSGTSRIDNIRDILHSTAEDLGAPGYDTVYGYGLIDAAAALVAVASDLTGLIVYPNPVETAAGHSYVTFEALTEEVTIQIFTVSGQLVRKEEISGQYSWDWDLKNTDGEKVARGVYIWMATNPAGEKKTAKIAVIK